MNPISLHLFSAHLPIGGGFVLFALLLVAARRRDPSLWRLGAALALGIAGFAAIAMTTGPSARSMVAPWLDSPGEAAVDRHEAVGQVASYLWLAAGALGLTVLAGLGGTGKGRSRIGPGLIAMTIAAVILSVISGASGGRIRHDELRTELARGTVFVDENGDAVRDPNEAGLGGVAVSNGRDVVLTDDDGRYEIHAADGDVVFVVKPRDHQVRTERNIPRFYHVHRPDGSPKLRYGGIRPTGPLPPSIDFPLTHFPEGDTTRAVLLADTQPMNERELGYVRDDVIAPLRGIQADFGITLGDVLHDDLALLPGYLDIVGSVGIPWYQVAGNHDVDRDAPDDATSLDTFVQAVGPANYSFDVGDAHFVALDNVIFEQGPQGPDFRGGFTEGQLEWLENDLAVVPQERLIVVLMHIPLRSTRNPDSPHDAVQDAQGLLGILAKRQHVVSYAGHLHAVEHHEFGREDGFDRDTPLRQHVIATACGSWWSGPPDERGIPEATQPDGTPNGWTLLEIEGSRATAHYRAARAPVGTQMRITADGSDLFVNVFDAAPELRVNLWLGDGQALPTTRAYEPDPHVLELERRAPATFKGWARAVPSTHLWRASLPASIRPGIHHVTARVERDDGRVHEMRTDIEYGARD